MSNGRWWLVDYLPPRWTFEVALAVFVFTAGLMMGSKPCYMARLAASALTDSLVEKHREIRNLAPVAKWETGLVEPDAFATAVGLLPWADSAKAAINLAIAKRACAESNLQLVSVNE